MHKVIGFAAGCLAGALAMWGVALLVGLFAVPDTDGGNADGTGTNVSKGVRKMAKGYAEVRQDRPKAVEKSVPPEDARGRDAPGGEGEVASEPKDEAQTAVAGNPGNPDVLVIKDRSIFTNGIEQLINMALPAAPGAPVPPLPVISDEGLAGELRRAMKSKISVAEGDDERTLSRKIAVQQGKMELGELTSRREMTVAEYINALRDQGNDNAEFMKEAHALNEELYHDEKMSDEEYKSARAIINEKLRERGLPEIEE